jgi:nucleoside-diphosphate-sugar epimerase
MGGSGKICVTGANSFIGAYCIAELLRNGYQVVGTVRSNDKASLLETVHGKSPNLTIAIVPDITASGAFDEALKGCTGVLHLASPFRNSYNNFETELLLPSIRGTGTICQSATATPTVKRVVVTSSFAAVYDASKGLRPWKVYTEEDWSPLTYEDGKNASMTPVAYRASKKLAEETAWRYVHKEKCPWELVTLCPGMVFGPLFPGTLRSMKTLNSSNQIIWSLMDAKRVPETRAPCELQYFGASILAKLTLTSVDIGQGPRQGTCCGLGNARGGRREVSRHQRQL